MIRLPGLIDIRCGISHGDNWHDSGSAALAGGFTAVIGLADAAEPVNTPERAAASLAKAAETCPCDYALLYQADASNARETDEVSELVAGLALDYSSMSPDMHLTTSALRGWRSRRPVCVRGTAEQIGAAIFTANMQLKPLHVSDVTTRAQLEIILESRQNGMRVSCDVSLSTLFFSREILAGFPAGRTALIRSAGSEEDRAFLWKNIAAIDCFTSAHLQPSGSASDSACAPALETAIPLLIHLVQGGFLTPEDIELKMCENPSRIFGLQAQQDSYIEVDETAQVKVDPRSFHSRAKVSPYRGMTFPGQLIRTVIRGNTAYTRENGLTAGLRGKNVILSPTPEG